VAEIELDREVWADMRRIFAKPVPLSKTERKRLHKLQARYDTLCDKYPNGDLSDADAAKLARIKAAIEALHREVYKNGARRRVTFLSMYLYLAKRDRGRPILAAPLTRVASCAGLFAERVLDVGLTISANDNQASTNPANDNTSPSDSTSTAATSIAQ
jgi:hypothetical protein